MRHPTPHHPLSFDAPGSTPARPPAAAIRWEKVVRVRRALAQGTYPLELAWERTLERVARSLDLGGDVP